MAIKREAMMSSTSSQAESSAAGKGRDGVQHMLEGQDDRKLAGAKDALKKKILRLVMQEAMEELGDADSLASQSIEQIGIDPADMERLNQGVRKHLIKRAATEVTEIDLDSISDAAADAALDNAEVDEAAGRVERKLLAAISDKALEGLADDGKTVQQAYESIADSNGGVIDELAHSVKDKLCAAIAAKAWANGIDADRVVDMASEKIDADHPSVAEAMERIQASSGDLILSNVLAQLSGDEATAALADEVSQRFKERMMGIVMERVSADPEDIAGELESEFGPQHETVVAASRKIRMHLLSMVRERALASFEDSRAAAREALVEIDEDHQQIAEATTALKHRLVKNIAEGALIQLGDAETAATSALKIARDSEQVIVTASNSVYETMARHVAEDARERCTDPDQLADAARDYMDPKDGTVSRAVSVVQTRLSELIANRAIASLDEDDRMTQLAREAAKKEENIVQATVEALRESIMDDIIHQVGETFSDAGDTARRAKVRMGQGNAALIAASEVLKELVLEELAKEATFTLLEPEKTGARAFERIDTDDPRFLRTTDNVRERLIREIAEKSLQAVSESAEAAGEARQHISETDDALVSATAVLRDQLISDIARRGTDSLKDTRAVAQQSRGRIAADNESMVGASQALREMLLQDMVEMTRGALQDAEKAAEEAMTRLSPTDEVFERVRSVFKERVLINVLGEAMREIGQNVAGPTQEAAMFHQALQALSARDAGRAGAWNGNGYQPSAPAQPIHPPTPAGERAPQAVTAEPPSLSVNPTPDAFLQPAAAPNESLWNQGASPAKTQSMSHIPAPAAQPTAGAPVASGQAPDKDAGSPVMEAWGIPVEDASTPFSAGPASTDGWVRLSDIDEGSGNGVVALDPPEPVDDFIVTEFVHHEEDQAQEDDSQTTPVSSERKGKPGKEEPYHGEIKFEVTVDGEPAWSSSQDDALPTAPAEGSENNEWAPPAEQSPGTKGTVTTGNAGSAAATPDMSWAGDDGLRCYVYGYVTASEVSATPPEGVAALAEHPIRFVTLRGIRAIVSKVPAAEFGENELAESSKDADWVKTNIRLHATVLDAFKTGGTVMPVRFGAVFENEADVAVMVSSEYDFIESTLERLKDKQEWSLRVTRDSDRLRDKMATSERTVEDSLGAISTGVAQFIKDEMDKSGELADAEIVATVTENCIRRTHDALMPWSVDGAQKEIFTAPGVDMVFNAAYLVESGQLSDFRAEVERLSKELEPVGMTLDITGPWPAYHFVDSDEDSTTELASVIG
jgi:Gas vesicle synthesis protein GvpL/GvpF